MKQREDVKRDMTGDKGYLLSWRFWAGKGPEERAQESAGEGSQLCCGFW